MKFRLQKKCQAILSEHSLTIYCIFFQKLEQISKLKEQQQTGKQLEMNQLEKIKKEAELTKELQELIL